MQDEGYLTPNVIRRYFRSEYWYFECNRSILRDSRDDYDMSISIPFGGLHAPCLKGIRKSHDALCQPDDSFRRIRSRRVL